MTEEQFWSGLGDYQERILNIITNLSSKTYVGIVNLKNKQTWWSQRVVDFFGLEKGVFDYAMEKSTVKVHPDDRDKYLKGFSDRMQGIQLGIADVQGRLEPVVPVTEGEEQGDRCHQRFRQRQGDLSENLELGCSASSSSSRRFRRSYS